MDWTLYIKPEFMILIPFMYAIGEFIKKSKLKNWIIPFILWGISLVVCMTYICIINSSKQLAMNLFTGAMQGTFIALITIGSNQLIKQATTKRVEDNEKAD